MSSGWPFLYKCGKPSPAVSSWANKARSSPVTSTSSDERDGVRLLVYESRLVCGGSLIAYVTLKPVKNVCFLARFVRVASTS